MTTVAHPLIAELRAARDASHEEGPVPLRNEPAGSRRADLSALGQFPTGPDSRPGAALDACALYPTSRPSSRVTNREVLECAEVIGKDVYERMRGGGIGGNLELLKIASTAFSKTVRELVRSEPTQTNLRALGKEYLSLAFAKMTDGKTISAAFETVEAKAVTVAEELKLLSRSKAITQEAYDNLQMLFKWIDQVVHTHLQDRTLEIVSSMKAKK